MHRIQDWRHPLRKSLPEREEITPERLIDCWMMHGRMWEHPLLITGRGGHLRDTLDTWLFWVNVLWQSHIPLKMKCRSRYGLMPW